MKLPAWYNDANEAAWQHRQTTRKYRKARAERRELAQARKEARS